MRTALRWRSSKQLYQQLLVSYQSSSRLGILIYIVIYSRSLFLPVWFQFPVSGETCALPVYTTGPVWLAVPRVPSGISLCHDNISIQCGSRLHCLSTR